MERFSARDFRELLECDVGPCVSLYFPGDRDELGGARGPIHLKNLLGEAEGRLIQEGMRPAVARELLKPAAALVDDDAFWRQPSAGLAVFITPAGMRLWRLSAPMAPEAWVGQRLMLKPLLPLAVDGRVFYL